MDTSSPSFLDHPISELVGVFLEAAQAVVASSDPAVIDAKPAELTYELDQVVSNYLDVHELSPDHYEVIQQNVVNSIAQHLIDDASEHGSVVPLDEQGNAGLTDVISLLDHHYSLDPQHDPIAESSAFFLDGGHHSGLG